MVSNISAPRYGNRKGLLWLIAWCCAWGYAWPSWAAPIVLDPQARTFPTPSRFITTGVYDPLDLYATNRGFGITFLDPLLPSHPLTREPLYFNFFNVLDRRFPATTGWKFSGDARRLSDGSLRVHSYDAIGGDDPLRRAGRPGAVIPTPIVGALFDVEYQPAANDPTANLHWIQVVSNNHRGGGAHGTLDNKVDVGPTQANPYYDIGGSANNRNLLDRPARPDLENDHDWIAALFLASGPLTPGEVTIYNDAGILWGWKNRFFPLGNLALFHDQAHHDLLDDLPANSFTSLHDEFHEDLQNGPTFFPGPFAVPEPSLALLWLAGSVGLLWTRRRVNQG